MLVAGIIRFCFKGSGFFQYKHEFLTLKRELSSISEIFFFRRLSLLHHPDLLLAKSSFLMLYYHQKCDFGKGLLAASEELLSFVPQLRFAC